MVIHLYPFIFHYSSTIFHCHTHHKWLMIHISDITLLPLNLFLFPKVIKRGNNLLEKLRKNLPTLEEVQATLHKKIQSSWRVGVHKQIMQLLAPTKVASNFRINCLADFVDEIKSVLLESTTLQHHRVWGIILAHLNKY